jgi:hypothetical protein
LTDHLLLFRDSLCATLIALCASAPLACGGTTAATRAAPPVHAEGVSAQAPDERGRDVFSGCLLETKGPIRFIRCAGASLLVQVNPIAQEDARSESEVLDLAVRQSGRQRERAALPVDGRPLDVRYVTDVDRLDLSMAITFVARAGERFVAICTQASRTLDRARCADAFTALSRTGIPAGLPPVQRSLGEVDFQGRPLALTEPCEVMGPHDLKCSNGQLTWSTAQSFPGLDSEAYESYRRVSSSMQEAGAREGETRDTACKVDGAAGQCKVVDWSMQAMGITRVVFAKASVRQQDTVIVCSYFIDKAPNKLPFPCGALLELP